MKFKNNMSLVVFVVAFVSMIGPFSIDTYLPSFPSIESDFSIDRIFMMQTIAVYLFATALSTLFWGPLSDRMGRKFVMLTSLMLYALASLGCALAESYSGFFTARIFQGLAASGGLVAGRAMVRDTYASEHAQRVMSYVLMLFALAPAIAPVIGGWLHHFWGWRSVFYFLSLYGGIMLLVTVTLHESLQVGQRQSFHPFYVARVYVNVILNLRFLLLVLAVATSFGGLIIYVIGAPTIIFNVLNLDNTDFWLLFVPITSGIISGSFISTKMARYWHVDKVINAAFITMILGAVINYIHVSWFKPDIFWLDFSVVIYAFGVAASMPGLSILALDCFPENKGSAAAMQSFVQITMSGLLAGVMLPLLPQSLLAYVGLQILLLVASIFLWRMSGRRHGF